MYDYAVSGGWNVWSDDDDGDDDFNSEEEEEEAAKDDAEKKQAAKAKGKRNVLPPLRTAESVAALAGRKFKRDVSDDSKDFMEKVSLWVRWTPQRIKRTRQKFVTAIRNAAMDRKKIVARALCFLPTSDGDGGGEPRLVAVEKEFSFHWRKRAVATAPTSKSKSKLKTKTKTKTKTPEAAGTDDEVSTSGGGITSGSVKCRHFTSPIVLCAPLANGLWANQAQFELYARVARSVKSLESAPMIALRRDLERMCMRRGRASNCAFAASALVQLTPWSSAPKLTPLLFGLRTQASCGAARFAALEQQLGLLREAISVGAAASKEGSGLVRRTLELAHEVELVTAEARRLVLGGGDGSGSDRYRWHPTSHTASLREAMRQATVHLEPQQLERTMRALIRHEIAQARIRAQAVATDSNRQLNQTFGSSVQIAAVMTTASYATLQPATHYARWALFRHDTELDDSALVGALALGRLQRICGIFATSIAADVDAASGGTVANEVDALWSACGRPARRRRHRAAVKQAREEEEAKKNSGFAGFFKGGGRTAAATTAAAAAASRAARRRLARRGARCALLLRRRKCSPPVPLGRFEDRVLSTQGGCAASRRSRGGSRCWGGAAASATPTASA
jgi:hypothetical protein